MRSVTILLLLAACTHGPSTIGADDAGGGDARSGGDTAWSDAAATDPGSDAGGGDDTLGSDPGGGDSAVDAGDPAAGPFTCTSCHGSADNAAPPRDTAGQSDRALPSVGAHRAHVRSSGLYRTGRCEDCHAVPTDPADQAHADGPPAELVWGDLARSDGEPEYSGSCSVYCHGRSLEGGALTTPSWTAPAGTQAYCGACHGVPPPSHGPVVACEPCHPTAGFMPLDPERHADGRLDVDAACGACHALPPDTGAHRVHAAAAAPAYGGLGTAADAPGATSYAFGCGHCHPVDPARHMNGGLAEIELYDPTVPEKSRSPSASYSRGGSVLTDASGKRYTLGTCSNVYCHSGMTTASGPVPEPGVDFQFAGYPISYPAYEVTRTRTFRDVNWGDNLTCGGCHGYPPRGESPLVTAGAGESHSYLRDDGFEDMHTFNHGFDPIPCRTCHAATVSTVAAFTRDAMSVTTFSDVPVSGFAAHADGTVEVAFDVANGFSYPTSGGPWAIDLAPASFDAATRSCSAVACHHQQSPVQFGTPYRPENGLECNGCHRY